MQLTGKVPYTGLSPDMRERKEREKREKRVHQYLTTDPAFQVRTVEGTHWICPFTSTLVACPPDSVAPIWTFLLSRQSWTGRGKARPAVLVLVQKWRLYLSQQGASEPRLRRFNAAGAWQNPFDGTWLTLAHPHQELNEAAIRDIAQALATRPVANSTASPALLSISQLDTQPATGGNA
jgi:hypothetical protein